MFFSTSCSSKSRQQPFFFFSFFFAPGVNGSYCISVSRVQLLVHYWYTYFLFMEMQGGQTKASPSFIMPPIYTVNSGRGVRWTSGDNTPFSQKAEAKKKDLSPLERFISLNQSITSVRQIVRQKKNSELLISTLPTLTLKSFYLSFTSSQT